MDGYGPIASQLSYGPYLRRISRLNAAEQRELNSRMEKKQMKEFMTVLEHQVPCSRTSPFETSKLRLITDVLETSAAML